MNNFIGYLSTIITIIIGIFSIIIYKLQLYKNTKQNVRKKKTVCNILIMILLIALFIVSYLSFVNIKHYNHFNDSDSVFSEQISDFNDSNSESSGQIDDFDSRSSEQTDDSNNWENAYRHFLDTYYNFIKETTNDFDSAKCEFAIYDIDKDGYPELLTSYCGIIDIYSYDVEKDQVVKTTNPFISEYPVLFASKRDNELIFYENAYDFSKTSLIICSKNDLVIQKYYSIIENRIEMGDFPESDYFYEAKYFKNSYEMDEDEYNNKIHELLYNKNQICFYCIADINDSKLSLYVTEVFY